MSARGGRHQSRSPQSSVTLAAGWRAQPIAIRVLRAFLGVTFLYAGVQKLADPNFLHAGSAGYIGTQLTGFAQGSPIGGLLRALDRIPVLAGLGIALAEIAVGLGTLLGIAPFLFAAGGLLINVILTLSATWHVHPYFLGADSMYAVGWAAYLAGLWEVEQRRRRGTVTKHRSSAPADAIDRREFIRGGALAGLTLVLGGVAKAMAGSPSPVQALPRNGGGGAGAPPSTPVANVAGTEIASLDSIPIGQAIGFQDPALGPAVLVRLGQENVKAYSRVCTHAGCLVGYDPSSRILVCPCHGAEFDPAKGAAVIAGPAPTPLPPINVAVDKATGKVVLPN